MAAIVFVAIVLTLAQLSTGVSAQEAPQVLDCSLFSSAKQPDFDLYGTGHFDVKSGSISCLDYTGTSDGGTPNSADVKQLNTLFTTQQANCLSTPNCDAVTISVSVVNDFIPPPAVYYVCMKRTPNTQNTKTNRVCLYIPSCPRVPGYTEAAGMTLNGANQIQGAGGPACFALTSRTALVAKLTSACTGACKAFNIVPQKDGTWKGCLYSSAALTKADQSICAYTTLSTVSANVNVGGLDVNLDIGK